MSSSTHENNIMTAFATRYSAPDVKQVQEIDLGAANSGSDVDYTKIPRKDPNLYNLSQKDFEKNAANNMKDLSLNTEKLVLRIIEKQEGSWTDFGTFKKEKREAVAYSVYQRTGIFVTESKVHNIFKSARNELMRRLRRYAADKLSEEAIEAKLNKWEMYSCFKYYRAALVQWERNLRVDKDVLCVDETGGLGSDLLSTGRKRRRSTEGGGTGTRLEGSFDATQTSTSISQPSTPIHSSSENSYLTFIKNRLNALSEEPAKKKLAMNAIVKVLLEVDESSATTTRQLFEELAR